LVDRGVAPFPSLRSHSDPCSPPGGIGSFCPLFTVLSWPYCRVAAVGYLPQVFSCCAGLFLFLSNPGSALGFVAVLPLFLKLLPLGVSGARSLSSSDPSTFRRPGRELTFAWVTPLDFSLRVLFSVSCLLELKCYWPLSRVFFSFGRAWVVGLLFSISVFCLHYTNTNVPRSLKRRGPYSGFDSPENDCWLFYS